MPKLTDANMEVTNIKGTNFQYSAAKLSALGATEYTLVTIVNDVSGSVASYKDNMEKCLKEIVTACRRSPRADNLMIRFITFSNSYKEEHGYKLLTECNPDDYLNSLHVGGMTALFDATANAVAATSDYAEMLAKNDFDVNAILFVMTDGADNQSTLSAKDVKKAIEKTMKVEYLESLVSVLIGVDLDPSVDQFLKDFKDEAGFTQYVDLGKADEKKLAKLAEFVSKSISSQSNSLGSGKASNQTSLTI
jgi:uncharacterized protein YegL